MKELELELFENKTTDGDIESQELVGATLGGTEIHFGVHDLHEYPEDAIISRSLFCAEQYVEALKLGMELAEEGYGDIKVNYTESYEE